MVSSKRFSFSLLNTEYAGRCTGLGNSLVRMGVRFTLRASSSKILRANSYQEHCPSALMWYKPGAPPLVPREAGRTVDYFVSDCRHDEFGAVVIIAYYPATAPVEIYNLFLQSGLTQSASAAVVLLIVTLATFLVSLPAAPA